MSPIPRKYFLKFYHVLIYQGWFKVRGETKRAHYFIFGKPLCNFKGWKNNEKHLHTYYPLLNFKKCKNCEKYIESVLK